MNRWITRLHKPAMTAFANSCQPIGFSVFLWKLNIFHSLSQWMHWHETRWEFIPKQLLVLVVLQWFLFAARCKKHHCSRDITSRKHYLRLLIFTTRMYSSRMRTVRCSGSLLGGEGVSARGGCLPGGCLADTTPPVNRMTDRCENIILPQLHCGR